MCRLLKMAVLIVLFLSVGLLPPVAGAQDDDGSRTDYPIATHYPAAGGSDAAPKRGEVEVSYGVYNNREDDYYAPSREEVERYVERVRSATGNTPLRLLNSFDDVEAGFEGIQLVNNVPVEGALYTIVLPPGWTPDGSYPVILSGNGAGISNNKRLYADAEIYAPVIAWLSTQAGRGGAIMVMSNCGGTESQGADEPTLRSVGSFFDFIAAQGGDQHNVVTTGGSRGGGTALVWAANPLDLDYTVRAVFAHVPPTHYGSLGTISLLTYPAMGEIAELALGDGGSRYTEGAATMENRLPEVLHILLGTRDVDEANARSPIGLAERLRGKAIAISAGTHDSFFQLALFLQFDRRLTELDIPHATAIQLGDGHGFSEFVYTLTIGYLEAAARSGSFEMPDGRFYFINDGGDQVSLDRFLGQPVEELPFTVELPARSAPGLPIDVSACGGVGKPFSITATGADGSVVWEASDVFDETECVTYQLETPGVGVYTWAFTYDGETVPATHTPFRDTNGCGVPALTEVLPEQPTLENTFYRAGYLSFGIDQFIAQGEDCD
jgi:dienelactone hydrolase